MSPSAGQFYGKPVRQCEACCIYLKALLMHVTQCYSCKCVTGKCPIISPLSPYSYLTARPSNQSKASCLSCAWNGQLTSCRYCTQEKTLRNTIKCYSIYICGGVVWWLWYLLVSLGPVWARDVPQVSSILDLVMSDLLVLQPHDAVPELCLIWSQTVRL